MKILFVSYDSSRTGAPIVLLHLLRWLKQNTSISIEIVLLKGGPLKSDFEELGPVYIASESYKIPSLPVKVFNKIFHKNTSDDLKRCVKKFEGRDDIDLIYGNTVVSAQYLVRLKEVMKVPTLLHMHELENVIRQYCGKYFDTYSKSIDQFVACSKLVGENLRENHNVTNFELIHEFVPSQTKPAISRSEILKELDLPDNVFVVGGSGTTDWRKGFDFYLQVAKSVTRRYENIVFLWVGGNEYYNDYHQAIYDIKNMELAEKVIVTGNKSNPIDFFNVFDIFLMTSREDPFPLVCIENALLKKPIICFETGVGSKEFIFNNTAYLDINEMSEEVIKYYNDRSALIADGERLSGIAQNFTVEKSGAKMLELINKTMKN